MPQSIFSKLVSNNRSSGASTKRIYRDYNNNNNSNNNQPSNFYNNVLGLQYGQFKNGYTQSQTDTFPQVNKVPNKPTEQATTDTSVPSIAYCVADLNIDTYSVIFNGTSFSSSTTYSLTGDISSFTNINLVINSITSMTISYLPSSFAFTIWFSNNNGTDSTTYDVFIPIITSSTAVNNFITITGINFNVNTSYQTSGTNSNYDKPKYPNLIVNSPTSIMINNISTIVSENEGTTSTTYPPPVDTWIQLYQTNNLNSGNPYLIPLNVSSYSQYGVSFGSSSTSSSSYYTQGTYTGGQQPNGDIDPVIIVPYTNAPPTNQIIANLNITGSGFTLPNEYGEQTISVTFGNEYGQYVENPDVQIFYVSTTSCNITGIPVLSGSLKITTLFGTSTSLGFVIPMITVLDSDLVSKVVNGLTYNDIVNDIVASPDGYANVLRINGYNFNLLGEITPSASDKDDIYITAYITFATNSTGSVETFKANIISDTSIYLQTGSITNLNGYVYFRVPVPGGYYSTPIVVCNWAY